MAGYWTASAESNKSPQYRLACRCKIYSGNYYNLCRFELSKIETNQKGFYSAGSFGGPWRHADLFHFVFQGCRVCRNTSDDHPRSVSLRCPLTWRFDLFRSWRCSLKDSYLWTNLRWSTVFWIRHYDSRIMLNALLYLFHWLNWFHWFNLDQSNKSNQLNKKRSFAKCYEAIFIP